jgi:Fe-S-cluster containining protein
MTWLFDPLPPWGDERTKFNAERAGAGRMILDRIMEFEPGLFALRRTPDGDCVYLGPQGCTIHGRHPVICKIFDCMNFVKRMDEGAFDYVGPRVENDIVKEGRRRIAAAARGKGECAR